MMAAYAAADEKNHVTIYEKNEKPGKKIYITGKGRCNVTNACDAEGLFSNVVTNPKFLYSAFYGFDNRKTMDFFEKEGCPLKIERGERVFPASDHASDITRALERALRRKNVRICLQTRVTRIVTCKTLDSASHARVCALELADGSQVKADAVILAAGGLSYPATGSTGDGYAMARELSHTVNPCRPSLVPLMVAEEWCASLKGLALKNVEISLELEGREIYSGFGEMLFTHFGVSGPLILSASSYYSAALEKCRGIRGGKKKGQELEAHLEAQKIACSLYLNLKPALDAEQLDRRLLRDFEANKNKSFKNALDGLFPARLIPVMLGLSGIDPEKRVNAVTKEERKGFAALIRRVPLTVTGTRDFKEAIITRGGIRVQEVNPSTMESRLTKGLYFAGEILDVDALTGGFNLQIAWSTGFLAGRSAAADGESDLLGVNVGKDETKKAPGASD